MSVLCVAVLHSMLFVELSETTEGGAGHSRAGVGGGMKEGMRMVKRALLRHRKFPP